MLEIEKNTVNVQEQIKVNPHVYFFPSEGNYKVIFVGNSITKHNPAESLGWQGDYGMAASCAEKDYVHQVMNELNKTHSIACCICCAGLWEQNYETAEQVLSHYEPARNFGADLIIMRAVENTPFHDLNKDKFQQAYQQFIDYLNPTGKAKVILTTSFWPHPGDEVIEQIAAWRSYPLIKLGDLGHDDEMKAIGLFEHSGVAGHPGDKGMAEIARRILNVL